MKRRVENLIFLVIEGAMNSAVVLSILADISPGPVALETSRADKRPQTSSTVHSKSSMLESSSAEAIGSLHGERGGNAWLKRGKEGVQQFRLFFIGVGRHTSMVEDKGLNCAFRSFCCYFWDSDS